MKIEKPGDVEGALREAFKQKERLVFLDFITDQKENVFPMVPAARADRDDPGGGAVSAACPAQPPWGREPIILVGAA
jgi:hypothetical protein